VSTVGVGSGYNPLSVWQDPNGVRKFSNAKLQSAIDDAIAASGDSHFVAVAHQVYNQNGDQIENVTKVSLLVKLDSAGKFSIAAGGYKDWTKGDLGAEAKVIWKPF